MEVSDSLISFKFNQNLKYDEIIKILHKGRSLIIIKEFPLTDIDFQSFISRIGVSLKENRNNNREDIFDVKISKQNNFFTSIANSNLAFPLHTDCADFDSIPNCIGLVCVEPAKEEQGTNSFMCLNNLIEKLSKNEIQELLSKKWKFRNQWRSILIVENDSYKICYDRITIESFQNMNENELEKLNYLDKLFENHSFKIRLEKGDLILFRNDLMLHGRDKIDIDSKRLIKRIRFNVN
uniref:TauD/TfdA family dioxygenase n=1 Tax=Flavobacterium sp. TaxID=239 RepID=UPI00404A0A47